MASVGFVSNYLAKKLLDHVYGATAYTAPVTAYIGLLKGELWQASHAYSSGDIAVATNFPTTAKVFKCTTGGTSAGSEPTFSGVAAGGTIADGGVTWTEQTNAIVGGTVTEMGTGTWTDYARKSVTNNTSNFPNATGSVTGVKTPATQTFTASATVTSGSLGIIGFVYFDASSGGNILHGGLFASFQAVSNGASVTFTSPNVTITSGNAAFA